MAVLLHVRAILMPEAHKSNQDKKKKRKINKFKKKKNPPYISMIMTGLSKCRL